MKKLVLLVILVTAIMMLFTASAAADPGGGADVFHDNFKYEFENSWCDDYWFPWVYCYEYTETGHINYQSVLTPSGNWKYTWHNKGEWSWNYAEFLFDELQFEYSETQEFNYHDQEVVKQGETQVYHSNDRATFENDYEICTGKAVFTFANGEIRTDKWEWVCEPK